MSTGILDYMMPIFISAIALLSLLLVWLVLRRQIKQLLARLFSRPEQSPDRCKCGYPLKGLDLARCPECGRATSTR